MPKATRALSSSPWCSDAELPAPGVSDLGCNAGSSAQEGKSRGECCLPARHNLCPGGWVQRGQLCSWCELGVECARLDGTVLPCSDGFCKDHTRVRCKVLMPVSVPCISNVIKITPSN